MAVKTKKKPGRSPAPASLVWFDIPADDMERARAFYSKLFGWNIAPFAAIPNYLHIDTAGPDASPNGGLMPRKRPNHPITIYVNVDSASKAAARVEKLGGRICVPKTAVPQMGYFAICQDTENNVFAVWEHNPKAR